MSYLKSLFFNFLVVFFANHILPGIDVVNQTKLPHLGGDLIFAIGLGFLNSLIFPILKFIDRHLTFARIAMISLVLNFAAYAVLKLLPFGIVLETVEGYLLASFIVSLGSFLINYLELKHYSHKAHSNIDDPPHPPNISA